METEMMGEYMLEKFGGPQGRREANLQALEDMTQVDFFSEEFERLRSEATVIKEQMYENTHKR